MEKTGTTMMREMHSKCVGVSMEGRQANVVELKPGQLLTMCHEEDNAFDTCAIKLFADAECTKVIGYIARDIAADIIKQEKEYGYSYTVTVKEITGGGKRTSGVNIVITAYR
jgi:hypothetical protein